ncbi:MAG: exo-alpha-sialidase, partial [Bacteroidales bacterium]|nr:exo-alpha-sialidase [Bacteroidales bacterium]
MNKFRPILLTFVFVTALIAVTFSQQQQPGKHLPKAIKGKEHLIDTRIDNMTYWRHMADMGYVEVAPVIPIPPAKFTGSTINARSVAFDDSPDVPVTEENSTQSENSIFVNPNDNQNVLNSNNSTQNPVGSLYGANDFYSFDQGETWGGELEGAGGANSGDPAAVISNTGTYYVGYIHNNYGQGVSYSNDEGQTWTPVYVASGGGGILDKNHLWIDNSLSSPYDGYLYDAWSDLGSGSPDYGDIEIARSIDGGLSWLSDMNISQDINAGSHNQGVNIHTGPGGEVYAAWAVYDSWPSDETAIGFARSFDGGETFEPSSRVFTNIRGIRTSETSKNHRVNSFPSMAVDRSGGAYNGTIYIVWTNIGVPGVNTDPDIDVYLIKSSDQGETWSEAIKVNQDPSGLGKEHYFPWITCDPVYGTISVIFYDDRNVASNQDEVFCAVSSDGAATWEDFKVS